MKTKLALAFLLLFLIAIPYAFASETEATVEVSVDPSDGQMTITGHLPPGAGPEATVVVLNPAGGVDYIDQTTVEADGSYLFRYTLHASVYGEYTVTVGGQGVQSVPVKHLRQSSGGEDGGGDQGGGGSGGGGLVGDTPIVEENRIRVAARVTDKRSAVSVSNDVFNRALQSGAQDGNDVVIAVETNGDDADSIEVSLPAEPFRSQADGVIRIQVRLPYATVTLTTDVMDIPAADARHVILSVDRVATESLPADIADTIKGDLVFEFRLTVDGRPIDRFKGLKSMHIALPYTLLPGEHPHTVVAVFISDSGDYEIIKHAQYDEAAGMLSFYAKHFSKYAVNVAAVSFDDLSSAAWAIDSVYGLAARGIVVGNGQGQFEPSRNVTRAEFVKMLVHSFDLLDAEAEGEGEFSDVSDSDWHYAEVMSAVQLGIVQGYPDGTFRADRAISREEMVVMAAQALAAAGIEPEPARAPIAFLDMDDIAGYAADDVLLFNRAGIVEGDELARFSPKANSSRAAAAKVVYGILQLQ